MLVELVRCDNPGLMELDGTNTWVLQGAEAGSCVVVDPGPPGHPAHLDRVAGGRRVELVLLTHGHLDHSGAVDEFLALTGAPTRAFGAEHCRGGRPLADGEEFDAAGLRFRVVHTPGHTRDSVSFVVGAGAGRAVLTGDTVLGTGTTLLSDDADALRSYLDSLDRLASLGPSRMLPGHGPARAELGEVVEEYRRHRRLRLDSIRGWLATAGLSAGGADPEAIVDELYAQTPADIRFAAVSTVRVQLAYLATEEREAVTLPS